jgi:hypothetical protein
MQNFTNICAPVFRALAMSLKKPGKSYPPGSGYLETSLGISDCGTLYVATDARHAMFIANAVGTHGDGFRRPIYMLDALKMREQYTEIAKGKGYIGVDRSLHLTGEFPFVDELQALLAAKAEPWEVQVNLEHLKVLFSAGKKSELEDLVLFHSHEKKCLYLGGSHLGIKKCFMLFTGETCVEILLQHNEFTCDVLKATQVLGTMIPTKSLDFVLSILNRFDADSISITVRKTALVSGRGQQYLCFGKHDAFGAILCVDPSYTGVSNG